MHSNNLAWVAPVRKSGMIFFLVGLFVFIGMLFVNQFKITSESLNSSIGNSTHRELIAPHLSQFMSEPVGNKVVFVEGVRKTFSHYNDTVYERYHLSTSDISAIMAKVKALEIGRAHV